jgi:hypothetical protein
MTHTNLNYAGKSPRNFAYSAHKVPNNKTATISTSIPVPIPVRDEFNQFNELYPGVSGFSKFDENNMYKFKPLTKWVGGKKQTEQWAMKITRSDEGATQKSAPFLLQMGGRKSKQTKRKHSVRKDAMRKNRGTMKYRS